MTAPGGARSARARQVDAVIEKIDELTMQAAEVFDLIGEMPVLEPVDMYASMIGDVEQALQRWVEVVEALSYRLQQDREKGRW